MREYFFLILRVFDLQREAITKIIQPKSVGGRVEYIFFLFRGGSNSPSTHGLPKKPS